MLMKMKQEQRPRERVRSARSCQCLAVNPLARFLPARHCLLLIFFQVPKLNQSPSSTTVLRAARLRGSAPIAMRSGRRTSLMSPSQDALGGDRGLPEGSAGGFQDQDQEQQPQSVKRMRPAISHQRPAVNSRTRNLIVVLWVCPWRSSMTSPTVQRSRGSITRAMRSGRRARPKAASHTALEVTGRVLGGSVGGVQEQERHRVKLMVVTYRDHHPHP